MHGDFYQMYLEEVDAIPVLEENEEDTLLERLLSGDDSVETRLVEGNLHRACACAKEYENSGCLMEDLVQEANIALTLAVREYKGEGLFHEWLHSRIRTVLQQIIIEYEAARTTGEEIVARVNVLKQICDMLEEELGREATVKELADRMKMTVSEITEIQKLTQEAIEASSEQEIPE